MFPFATLCYIGLYRHDLLSTLTILSTQVTQPMITLGERACRWWFVAARTRARSCSRLAPTKTTSQSVSPSPSGASAWNYSGSPGCDPPCNSYGLKSRSGINNPSLFWPRSACLINDIGNIPVACQLHRPELYLGGDDAVLLGVILLRVQPKERRKTEEVMKKDRLQVQCKYKVT